MIGQLFLQQTNLFRKLCQAAASVGASLEVSLIGYFAGICKLQLNRGYGGVV